MVRTWALQAAALLLMCPAPGGAQGWSAEQQAIIDVVVSCFDSWTESIRQKDYEVFAGACPQTTDTVYWYTNRPAPSLWGGDDGVWAETMATGNLPTWSNLVPKTVQVQGDMALIYLEVIWTQNTPDGRALPSSSRRMFAMRRVDGRWRVAGGTSAAIPPPTTSR